MPQSALNVLAISTTTRSFGAADDWLAICNCLLAERRRFKNAGQSCSRGTLIDCQICLIRLERHTKPAVLVVEDETFVRKAACAILEGAGYEVLAACNAEEAKELLEDYSESVGILFSDVVLPGQNGCELADELRAERPALQTILTSGYPCEADEDGCHNGVFYLPKPFSADALLGKVRLASAHAPKSKPV